MDRGYLEHLTAFQPGGAFIGRLASTARIEAGPVEGQVLSLDCGDDCIRFEAIAILDIKVFGGRHAHNFTTNPAQQTESMVCAGKKV